VDNQLPPSYKPYSDGELKGGFTKIIIFGAIGFVLIGLVFLFVFKQGGDSPQPVNKAKATVKIETPKTDAKTSAEASKSLGEVTGKKEEKPVDPKSDAKTVKKATPAAKVSTPAGEIVNVQTKTGRSYIIIGSFIDQDLANDFAKELASAGKGVKIIFPYDNSKRYRVSIADFDSYSDAAVQISSFKSTYGDGAWVLKY
jgi:cell division protein FtsN